MAGVHVYNDSYILDRRLSYKARGLLGYMLNQGKEWHVNVDQLIEGSDEDGRIAVQSGLKELLKYGYAKLLTDRDKQGRVCGKHWVIYSTPTNKQETRKTENLLVGTDKQETRLSENAVIGKSKSGVVTSSHRQAGFPSDGKPDSQKTCSIGSKDLETKDTNKEKSPDLTIPPYTPPMPAHMESYSRMEGAFVDKPQEYTPGFLDAWNAWPMGRKQGKKTMWQLWCHHNLEARAAEIVAKIDRLNVTLWRHREARFVPTPKTWFEEGRYEDDLVPLEAEQPAPPNGRRFANTLDLAETEALVKAQEEKERNHAAQ